LKKDLLVFLNESDHKVGKAVKSLDPSSFVYHRLDLLSPPPRACKYFKQLATLETAGLFLSSVAFENPNDFLTREESRESVRRIMSFVNDCNHGNVNVNVNPGLRSGVREDILTLSRITTHWLENSKTKYVVRRFVATESGVFLVYPGTAIDRSYHPLRRDWYRRALQNPGRVVFTAPYLDVGGSGYIVTLSYALLDTTRGDNMGQSRVIGVMGIDFTLGFFHKLLMESLDICSEQKVTCFLMDDRGYLVAHPSLVEPSGRGPVEYTHVTHKEPVVSNNLLQSPDFMAKKSCTSRADCTIQRYYNLNTSIDGILSNVKSVDTIDGPSCPKYRIVHVPETNIFIGVVNESCIYFSAFCACSVVDRLCLNCERIEQTDCECPCECPLAPTACPTIYEEDDHGLLYPEEDPSCAPYPDDIVLPHFDGYEDVPSCFQVDCSTRKSESDCLGVLGCEWCQLDSTGKSLGEKSFCHYQRECFGGMLGVRTPYTDESLVISGKGIQPGSPPEFSRLHATPIFLTVVATGMFIALILICRCYLDPSFPSNMGESLYANDHLDRVRMSHLDGDGNNAPDDEPGMEDVIKPAVGQQVGLMLANFDNATGGGPVISPYRVNSNYRKPPGGDSDNGYSTMTTQDSDLTGPVSDLQIARSKSIVVTKATPLSSSGSRASSLVDETSSAITTGVGTPVVGTTVIAKNPNDAAVIAEVHVIEAQ